MAKKRAVKRRSKKILKTKQNSKSLSSVAPSKKKFGLVLKNLGTFLILLIVSILLYSQSSTDFWINFFLLLSMLFGFLVMTFLLVFLVFLFLKILRK